MSLLESGILFPITLQGQYIYYYLYTLQIVNGSYTPTQVYFAPQSMYIIAMCVVSA